MMKWHSPVTDIADTRVPGLHGDVQAELVCGGKRLGRNDLEIHLMRDGRDRLPCEHRATRRGSVEVPVGTEPFPSHHFAVGRRHVIFEIRIPYHLAEKATVNVVTYIFNKQPPHMGILRLSTRGGVDGQAGGCRGLEKSAAADRGCGKNHDHSAK
jgi:hypothetical protein